MNEILDKHIKECEDALETGNPLKINEVGRRLRSIYFDDIKSIARINIDKGKIDENQLNVIKESLEFYKAKKINEIELQKNRASSISLKSENPVSLENVGIVSNSGNSNNTNQLNIKTMFDSAKKTIEENQSLGDAEVQDILEKIKEIEKIESDEISKKQKWSKLKTYISWIGNKGVKVAKEVLPLIMNMIEE